MHVAEIKNDEDLQKAIARLDEIWSAKPGDSDWEERYELVERVAVYEDEHVLIPPPDPIDAIRFRMEQSGMRDKDLVGFIGSPSKVSEVLSGKRALSKEMIRRLHEGLGIPLRSLLGVSDNAPDGFVSVEWMLPIKVVQAVTNAARKAQITEEQWITQNLNKVIANTKNEGEIITGKGIGFSSVVGWTFEDEEMPKAA